MLVAGTKTELAGWGANLRVDCLLTEPGFRSDVSGQLSRSGTIARGLNRSYGDCAINANGQVIGTSRMDRFLAFDAVTGTLVCEAGTSLESIIGSFAPRGWFPMITPGTKFVTVAGCIANDIHGKAHHAQGCFSSWLATGEVVTTCRTEKEDLFWATFGGMGLLGVILTAAIRLRRIETTYFHQKSVRVNDLEGMLAALDEYDRTFPY
jgi:decaprenylphospho-beta-D-ribofuranose 2-oxidase